MVQQSQELCSLRHHSPGLLNVHVNQPLYPIPDSLLVSSGQISPVCVVCYCPVYTRDLHIQGHGQGDMDGPRWRLVPQADFQTAVK